MAAAWRWGGIRDGGCAGKGHDGLGGYGGGGSGDVGVGHDLGSGRASGRKMKQLGSWHVAVSFTSHIGEDVYLHLGVLYFTSSKDEGINFFRVHHPLKRDF